MKNSRYYVEHFLVPQVCRLSVKGEVLNCVIRPGTEEKDLQRVQELLRRDFGLLPDLYRTATNLADIIVAEVEGKTMGMAIIMKLRAHDGFPAIISVPWISVDLHVRRRGIGTALIQYVKTLAGYSGISRIDAARNLCTPSTFLSREGFRSGRKSPAYHDGYFTSWSASPGPTVPLPKRVKYVPLSVLRREVHIRRARPEDRMEWKTLVLQACDLKVDHDVMQSTLTADLRLVAEDVTRGKVIGLVAANPGWIMMLGCDPENRNGGLGSLLMFCALEWCAQQGKGGRAQSASLTPLTARAQRFYESWGFHEEDSTKKDGYATMTIELTSSSMLPQGLELKDIIHDEESSEERGEEGGRRKRHRGQPEL